MIKLFHNSIYPSKQVMIPGWLPAGGTIDFPLESYKNTAQTEMTHSLPNFISKKGLAGKKLFAQ